MKKTGMLFVLLGLFGFMSVNQAQADSKLTRVRGVVSFERRESAVPHHIFCAGVNCSQPKPQPYWAMILKENPTRDDSLRYESDQAFARGSETAPSEVNLSGANIHAGTMLVADAVVAYSSENYAVISQIQNVSETSAPPISPTAYGWQCRDLGHGGGLNVEVFYHGDSTYLIHVATGNDRSEEQIANVNSAHSSQDNGWVVYQGNDNGNAVELRIGTAQDPAQGSPGILNLGRLGAFEIMPYPPVHQFNLVCYPTRSAERF